MYLKKLFGTVIDGRRDCSKWPNHLLAHYQRLSGLNLIKGTLNIKLSEPYLLSPNCIRLPSNEWGGEDVLLARCQVNGHDAVIIRTQENEFHGTYVPQTIVEIASDTHLRRLFGLKTGDVIELTV